MADVHTTVMVNKSGSQVKIDNPGVSPTTVGAGVPVTSTGNNAARTAAVHGQVPGTSVVIHNPA